MAIKSQFNLPDGNGGYETHHLETEVAQIADATIFSQEILKTGADAEDVRELLNINYCFRKANTAYALGDIIYINALAVGKKLVCVKAGTSGDGALTITSTDEGALITDGTVTWIIDSLADGIYDAAHQNSDFRGADLTAYWDSGLMSANIQAGKFVGMHIGDYIVKSVTASGTTYNNVKWLFAAFDPHLHCGYDPNNTDGKGGVTTDHHVLIIPNTTLQRNVSMNDTDTTSGGYLGSKMWKTHIPAWATGIKNAFGSSHILPHWDILSNSVDNNGYPANGLGRGVANNWAWTKVEVNIPNEPMVYGGNVWASSAEDVGSFPRQLPLFALKCSHLYDRSWFWLRAVASSSYFANANSTGDANIRVASDAGAGGGIRPYSLLR